MCRKENPALIMGTDRGDMELRLSMGADSSLGGSGDDSVGGFTMEGTAGADQVNCVKGYVGAHSLQNAGSSTDWAAA